MHIYDKHKPSRIVLLQHKICIDLFCCSWNLSLSLSSAWCNRYSFQLTVCVSFRFLPFFLTSLNTKEWKLFWYVRVLLWTNIIEKKLHNSKEWITSFLPLALIHHPSTFYSVIHLFSCLRTATRRLSAHSFFFRYKRRDWQADVGVLFWFFNRSVNFIQQNNDTGEYDSDVSIISFYGYRVWLVHINISYSMCFFLYKCMQWINLCRSRRMLNNDEY